MPPQGGFGNSAVVWEVKASSEDHKSGTGWTELSSNGNGVGVDCCPSPINCFCDWSSLGQAFPHGTLMDIYAVETQQIVYKVPLTDVGNGSSFAPAIGLTKALRGQLGLPSADQSGWSGTVHIKLSSGKTMSVAQGFGSPLADTQFAVKGAKGITASGGVAGAGGTGSGQNGAQASGFRVGDTSNPSEDFWTAVNRLAQERYWYLFSDGEVVYLADGPDLMAQKPVMTLDRILDAGVIHHLEFTWDNCLALDTPIPTPHGWTMMGDLQTGDFVFGSDGKPTRVVRVAPVHRNRECYRVTLRDGTSIVSDDSHLWETTANRRDAATIAETRHQKYLGIRSTRLIRETLHVNGRESEPNHQIRLAGPLDLPIRDLSIDPYVFGYWLGDGDSVGPALAVGEEDKDELLVSVASAGYSYHAKQRPPRGLGRLPSYRVAMSLLPEYRPGRRNEDTLTRRLRDLGVLGDKHIPTTYLRASADQRLELLRGLMDSDGSVGRACEIGFASKRLAEDVTELVRSLGYRTTGPRWKAPQGASREQWSVGFATREHMNCFRIERKASRYAQRVERKSNRGGARSRAITSIEPVPTVPVRCIEVEADDHLFLAGEGFCITRNTAFQYVSTHKKRVKIQRRSTVARVQSPVEATLEVICQIDQVRAGDVIQLTSCGPGDGRWLVGDCTRSVFDIFSKMTLVPAIQPLTELEVAGAGTANTTPGSPGTTLGPPGSFTGTPNSRGVINPCPTSEKWYESQLDFGVDLDAPDGAKMYAPADCTIVNSIIGGFAGQDLVLYQFDVPLKGAPSQYWYASEGLAFVSTTNGMKFKQGAIVARMHQQGTGVEIGWGVNDGGASYRLGQQKLGAGADHVSSQGAGADPNTNIYGSSFKAYFGVP